MPFDPVLGTPPQDGVTGQFRPVIADYHARLSTALDQGCQLTRDTAPRDRGVRNRGETFTGDVVDHVEHAEALAIGELVMDEIERLACIGPRLDQDRGSRSDSLAPGLPLAHRKPFLAVKPIDPVDAGRLALTPQQHEEPPIAKPSAFVGQLTKAAAQLRVRSTLRPVADHLAICPDNLARPPFREPELGGQMRDRLALHSGRHHFFETSSFIAAKSSICSASSFLSFAFSSSSAFSRLASDTVMPPNLAFQL